MRYKVVRSFAGDIDGVIFSHGMGEIIDESEIPEGADWIRVGFLEEIVEEKKPKKATTRTKKAVDKVMKAIKK